MPIPIVRWVRRRVRREDAAVHDRSRSLVAASLGAEHLER
jgi:hypothetical protein